MADILIIARVILAISLSSLSVILNTMILNKISPDEWYDSCIVKIMD